MSKDLRKLTEVFHKLTKVLAKLTEVFLKVTEPIFQLTEPTVIVVQTLRLIGRTSCIMHHYLSKQSRKLTEPNFHGLVN